jgi:hypothetical protein
MSIGGESAELVISAQVTTVVDLGQIAPMNIEVAPDKAVTITLPAPTITVQDTMFQYRYQLTDLLRTLSPDQQKT